MSAKTARPAPQPAAAPPGDPDGIRHLPGSVVKCTTTGEHVLSDYLLPGEHVVRADAP